MSPSQAFLLIPQVRATRHEVPLQPEVEAGGNRTAPRSESVVGVWPAKLICQLRPRNG
ncbi:MAG TPA: hypothetical protein VI136_25580 [Verrucomicrobiae bacterium]